MIKFYNGLSVSKNDNVIFFWGWEDAHDLLLSETLD